MIISTFFALRWRQTHSKLTFTRAIRDTAVKCCVESQVLHPKCLPRTMSVVRTLVA